MDWLEQHSPMQVDWVHKWAEFTHQGQPVRLVALQPKLDQCAAITGEQLYGMLKSGSVLNLVQLVEAVQPNNEIPAAVKEVIHKYQAIFSEPKGLPPRRDCDHQIPLKPGAQPVNLRPYRYNPELKNEIERQVAEMLLSGVIQPSRSAWSSPALLVRKNDGTWRLCVDYRHLNALTEKSKYPMPLIKELLD